MNEALASYESMAVMGDDTSPRNQSDEKLFVTFSREAMKNDFKSAEAGRPIFDEVDLVRIMVPGNRLSSMLYKATEEHKWRFPKQWAKYQQGLSQAQEGTPLEMWPQMTVGQVAELKAVNIHSVEQLAAMPDNLAQQFMGNFQLRQKAQTFLDAAKGEAVTTKLQAELAKRDNEIEVLKRQMAEVLEAKSKKG